MNRLTGFLIEPWKPDLNDVSRELPFREARAIEG